MLLLISMSTAALKTRVGPGDELSRAEQDLLQTSSSIQLLAPNDRVDHRLTAAVGEVFSKSFWHLETVASIPWLIPTTVVVVAFDYVVLIPDGTKFAIFALKMIRDQ